MAAVLQYYFLLVFRGKPTGSQNGADFRTRARVCVCVCVSRRQAGNYEAAVEGFRRASQLRPLKHSHLTCLGKVYLRWGGHEAEALAALTESLRIERTSVAATLAAKAHAALERAGQVWVHSSLFVFWLALTVLLPVFLACSAMWPFVLQLVRRRQVAAFLRRDASPRPCLMGLTLQRRVEMERGKRHGENCRCF